MPRQVGPLTRQGSAVIQRAIRYAMNDGNPNGVTENPAGSNDDVGGKLSDWQSDFNNAGNAWCGVFAGSMYREVFRRGEASDGGIAHPSVASMYHNAGGTAAGTLLSRVPWPGCYVLFINHVGDNWTIDSYAPYDGGIHVEIFVRWRDYRRRMAYCIGGNTSQVSGVPDPDGGGVWAHTLNLAPKPENKCAVFAIPRILRGQR